ncbi:hypothetical protein ACFL58_00575 [Elusimicrobiota bacterium]
MLINFTSRNAEILLGSNYIDKEYRNSFLSSNLQKNYYSIQVQTLRFFDRQRSDVNGLVESFRGSARYMYDIFTKSFAYGQYGALDAQSFTYDGSIAILSYLVSGQIRKARQMLDVYSHEFYHLKNGNMGLLNCYATDRPSNGGLAMGIDSRIHLGPNMWVTIAGLQYTAITGDLTYLDFLIDEMKWAQSLEHYVFPDGRRGGVSMGFGWGADWSKVFSTENNVDYYAALIMMKEIYEKGGDKVRHIFKANDYGPKDMISEIVGLRRWLKQVIYDKENEYLTVGFNEHGVDRVAALDTVSWTIAALGPKTLKKMGIDPFKLMDFAERNFLVTDEISGVKVSGFDFTNTESRGRDLKMMWMEGTGFHIVAYQVMSDYADELGLYDLAKKYRKKAKIFSDELQYASVLVNFKDGALPYTSKKPKEKEIILTFKDEWEIPRGNKGQWVASSSSTGWRFLSLAAFNPLSFNHKTVYYKLFASSDTARLR